MWLSALLLMCVSTAVAQSADDIAAFREQLDGALLDPSSGKTFDSAAALQNTRLTAARIPAMIVKGNSTADVQASLLFAQRFGLDFSVKASNDVMSYSPRHLSSRDSQVAAASFQS